MYFYKFILSEFKVLCVDFFLREKVWVSDKVSYVVSEIIFKDYCCCMFYIFICIVKVVKNLVELEGMRWVYIKDVVVFCEFFNWLEKEVFKGGVIEILVVDKVEEFCR